MSEWLLQSRDHLTYRVHYKKSFVAEIFYSQGQFEIIDRSGVSISHDIAENWTDSCDNFKKETIQRLLFAIKQHIDCSFSFIDYEIE